MQEQTDFLEFISDFRLGQNYRREFIGYLNAIADRDRIDVSTILGEDGIANLRQYKNLPHARKMDLLRAYLMKRRYETPISRDDFIQSAIKPEEKEIVCQPQKGRWLKRCPGTQQHICCNYIVINSISGCPYDCTYCYLHSYLNQNGISVYKNHEDLFREIGAFFEKHHKTHYRIGTGEFSDSLALDKAHGLSAKLINIFAKQEQHLLELKTKSAEVDHLLNLQHNGKTVFAWSVNPEIIIGSEELGTVSLEVRLKAARKCAAAGYPVAFHFDPIIYYKEWEQDYQEVVSKIFYAVNEKQIAWISLGALRCRPEQPEIMRQKFPHSRIMLGELYKGEDNKLRYLKPIRRELFKKMHELIRFYGAEVYIYLCMESEDLWEASKISNPIGNAYEKFFSFFNKA